MLSMTGYGRAQEALLGGHVVIEARAVNHRYLDVRVRFPPELSPCAAGAEAIARTALTRGRVDLTARTTGPAGGHVSLDRARAKALYTELQALRDEIAPDQPVPLAMLSAVPDLFVRSDAPNQAAARQAVERATRAALESVTAMRYTEGAALARELLARLAAVRAIAAAVQPHTTHVVAEYRAKLHKRIATLLEGSGVELDAARLEHEVAAFADRADVAEELARLMSHCDQFASLVESDAAVGRRLDFLLQEMGREANTMGSKIADVEITRQVVELKAELERMREQVQNVL